MGREERAVDRASGEETEREQQEAERGWDLGKSLGGAWDSVGGAIGRGECWSLEGKGHSPSAGGPPTSVELPALMGVASPIEKLMRCLCPTVFLCVTTVTIVIW